MNTLGNFFVSKVYVFVAVGVVLDGQDFNHLIFLKRLEILIAPVIVDGKKLDVFCEFDFHCSDILAEFL